MLHQRRGLATSSLMDPNNPTVRILHGSGNSYGIDRAWKARRIAKISEQTENSSDLTLYNVDQTDPTLRNLHGLVRQAKRNGKIYEKDENSSNITINQVNPTDPMPMPRIHHGGYGYANGTDLARRTRRSGKFTGVHASLANPNTRLVQFHGNSKGMEFARRGGTNGKIFPRTENSSDIELSPTHARPEDDSGIPSPPLWKTSPPTTPKTNTLTLQHHLSMSPRSEEIAKGREEMMEMMQGMHESTYELSLRDLVELPLNKAVWQPHFADKRDSTSERSEDERKLKIVSPKNNNPSSRHGGNGPFLLKMFFPPYFGKSKKKSSRVGACSKVSPKPPPVAAEMEKVGTEKTPEGEWLKKNFSVAGESVSSSSSTSKGSVSTSGSSRSKGSVSTSSSSSSSTSTGRSRRKDGFSPGCCFFFFA